VQWANKTESSALLGQSSSLDMESSLVILLLVVITLHSIACVVVCVLPSGNLRGVLEVPVSGLRCEVATGGYFCVCEVYEVFSCMKTL
jgi:hypothetical protein